MLISKEVQIMINNTTQKYYENLGYFIPKRKDRFGKIRMENGTKIIVKVNDLYKKSQSVKIEVECDYCNKNFYKTIGSYYKGHKIINKDCCEDCISKKNYEIHMFKYGTNSIKIRSEVEGFKIGRNKIDGKQVYQDFIDKGFCPQFKPEDYTNCKTKLPYICSKHESKGILYTNYDNLKNGDSEGCLYCGCDARTGENSSSWKGGITPELDKIRKSQEYSDWRNNIFQKDKYTCQCCGDSKGGNLEAHHLLNFAEYPDLRFDVNNGTTLCNKCHNFNQIGSFHHTYGAKNNTPEQLWEYIQRRNNG